jgi:organic hydroperoxide reductase OsmC/OhrA
MAMPKTPRFPVDVRWLEGKLTVASVPGKEPLRVATPPVFPGGIEGVWSPEDLFVAALASCLTVTLVSAARRRDVPLRSLAVRGTGDVTARPDGRYGFVSVALEVDLATDAGFEAEARNAALDAERSCLIAASLDVPLHVTVAVRPAAEVA